MNLEGVKRYKVQPWKFFLVYRGASYLFTYKHVLAPAANRDRPVVSNEQSVLYRQLHKLQRLWSTRVKTLVANNLWTFGARDLLESIHFSVRRRIFCTPENVKLVNKYYRGRPCSEYHVCPFCFARRSRWLYKKAAKFLKDKTVGQRSRLYAVTRVSKYFVPANGFSDTHCWPDGARQAAAKRIRDRLRQELKKYKEYVRTLRYNTVGSAWCVVVNPVTGGWDVEVRQLSITTARYRNSFIRLQKAKTAVLAKTKLDTEDAWDTVLGPFVTYPKGLLYEYDEMAAVALQARYGLRLFNTTGCLAGKRPNGQNGRSRQPNPESPSVSD